MREAKGITYRFSVRDQTGWFLGLNGVQCVAIGLGILATGGLLNAGAPVPLVLAPLVLSAAVAFGQWQGRPLHVVGPIAAAWAVALVLRGHRWTAPLPRWRHNGQPARTQPALPSPLSGTTIDECDIAWTRTGRAEAAAIIRDRDERTVTAIIRASGRGFSLSERGEQQRLLALWGDALGAFCAERGPVARFRWTEWAAPAGLDGHNAYLARHQVAPDNAPAVAAYRDLLASAGSMATRHEVLISVTVAERNLRRGRPGSPSTAIDEILLEEVRLLSTRLDNAGLTVSLPLSPSEVAHALRARLDPHAAPGTLTRKRSLTELAGLVSVANAGPLIMETAWDHVRVDRSFHASYVIAEWPRLEVPPNWMEPLLLHAGGIRTIAIHYEPIPQSRSQRQIDRDSVKLAAEEEQRHRQGFRIGARHRRAQADVVDREAELVAGYPELDYVGTVTITAADLASLERSCTEYEQVAAQTGIELRRLDGQHDLALPCALPLGRGVAGKPGLA